MSNRLKIFKTEKCSLLPMGSGVYGDDLHFSINTREKVDRILLYKHGTKEVVGVAYVDESMHFGNLYALCIKESKNYDYAIMSGDKFIRDEYGKSVNHYKIKLEAELEKSYLNQNPVEEFLETYTPYQKDFDWGEDERVFHSFEDSILYRLHVKGFTKHTSSKVEHKGCYLGVAEKIPYLKELGITTVELMPAYEFDETILTGEARGKTNYWGYGSANYFAPKAAFSKRGKGSQINEFKEMVKQLHRADIEVIMEFHFVSGMSPHTIMDVLRFWVLEYHIDGIHANFDVAPLNMIKSDPVISMVKIIANYSTGEDISGYNICAGHKRFAVLNQEFIGNTRRFLKSDDNQVAGMLSHIKRNPEDVALINYLSNHDTMTLMDSVSYDKKHNEANGENNRDGNDYNFSWNCGVEGTSRKKKVVELRKKQIRNGIAMLMTAQATPMLYAGDEMGKSCKGNNNPYCQDNEISWLNWNDLITNRELFEYMKEMIAFRKNHKVLHQNSEPRMMDYKSLGCPDMSLHGEQPWKVDDSYNSRSFAFMYNGNYGEKNAVDIYVAFNMNWDKRRFAIPYIDKKKKWVVAFSTDKQVTTVEKPDRMITLEPRTVCILVSEG